MFFQIAKYSGQQIKFQESEVSGGRWFTTSEIDAMISQNPDDFIVSLVSCWKNFKHFFSEKAA